MERQSEACPGLTGPPTVVPGALVALRFLASGFYSIRVDHGSMLSLFEGPVRRRDFIPERSERLGTALGWYT